MDLWRLKKNEVFQQFQLSSMARVMAHEIAHLLHTRHDGDRNECNPGVSARRLMTPVISPEVGPFTDAVNTK